MLLKYKNFIAEINYMSYARCFYGEVININKDSLIVFQAEYKKDLEAAFKIAVEQYIEFIGGAIDLTAKVVALLDQEAAHVDEAALI